MYWPMKKFHGKLILPMQVSSMSERELFGTSFEQPQLSSSDM